MLAAAVLWGTIGSAYQLLRNFVEADEVTVVTVRAGTASLVLSIWLLIRDRSAFKVRPRDLPYLVTFGIVTVTVFYLALIFTFSHTSVAVGTVLLYFAPALVVMGGAAFLGEPVTRGTLSALVMALLGCLLVVEVYRPGAVSGNMIGLGMGLLSATSYAAYSVMGKPLLKRYRIQTVLLYHLAAGTAGLLGVKLVLSPSAWPELKGMVLIGTYTGLVTTLAPIALYSVGLRMLPSGDASVLTMLEPVVAVVLATTLLGERLSVGQLGGAAFVLFAVLVLTLRSAQEKRRAAPVMAPQ